MSIYITDFPVYKILFGYSYSCSILRKCSNKTDQATSNTYTLSLVDHFENITPSVDEVLKDLIYKNKAGQIELKSNDYVYLKFNRLTYSFHYIPNAKHQCFSRIEDIFSVMKKYYLNTWNELHLFLNLADKTLYSLEEIIHKEMAVYCINSEEYSYDSSYVRIESDYYIYRIMDGEIQNCNIGNPPYYSIKNTLYYLEKFTSNQSTIF